MSTLNACQLLKEQVDLLSDEMAEEVSDFVFFVRARRKEEEFLGQQVQETREHRQQHPQDAVVATAGEWVRATDSSMPWSTTSGQW
jgi:hypothetical protein